MAVGRRTPEISAKERQTKEWFSYKDLFIHTGLFDKGITVIRSPQYNPEMPIDDTHFFIKDREFSFIPRSDADAKKPRALIMSEALVKFAHNKETIAVSLPKQGSLLRNRKRHEETFIPIVFNQGNPGEFGLYLYPWLSQKEETAANIDKFFGFEEFVTAGCLLGSSAQGKDQRGFIIPELIKHNYEFHPGQKIHRIQLQKDSPYEDKLFADFEKSACFIDAFTMPEKPKKLLYHLPYYDYTLFVAIEMFIRGHITLVAMGELLKIIFEKKSLHVKTISEICKTHNIDVTFESPFENLFNPDLLTGIENQPQEDQPQKDRLEKLLATVILKWLNIDAAEIDPKTLSEETRTTNEKRLVKSCIERLRQNTFHRAHQAVWADFTQAVDHSQLNNLEDLFKLANAVMVAVAARGKRNYRVCSLLPLSEKQIQLGYTDCLKKYPRLTEKYPAIYCATLMESLVTYSFSTAGMPFYYSENPKDLSKLITREDIIGKAYKNVGLFSTQKVPTPLHEAITPPSPGKPIRTERRISPPGDRL